MYAMPRLPSAAILASIVAAFFTAGFLVYGASLGNDFVSWDDTGLIRDNPNVHELSLKTVRNVFTTYDPELYIPLTFLSYQIDHIIGGLHPFVYHLTNLVLHIVNALLVTWFLYLVLQREWLALFLGAIFLLHPLNTEAVAWASARKDVLSTCFFLGSLLCWMYARDSGRTRLLVLSVILFTLGALSKVMVITLPVVLVMIDMLDRRSLTRRTILEKLPFFLIGTFFGVIAIFGKAKILVASTMLQKVLMACKATIFYLTTFFVPANLSVMYPYTGVIRLSSPDFFVPVLLTIAVLLAAWFFRRRNKLVTFGILFFVLTLMPTFTNFAKAGDMYVASDRYAYIPMIGLLLAIGAVIARWSDRPGGVRVQKSRRQTQRGFALVLLALCAFLSAKQSGTWRDSMTLYDHVLAHYPNAISARNNRGMEFLAAGKYDDAIREFDLASAIRKNPMTQANRAAALVAKGSLDEALVEFEKALALDPTLPDALYGIGNVYQKRGELQKAALQYRMTLESDPTYTNALNNLGAVYIKLELWDEAMRTFTEAIRQRPDFEASYLNLAGVYLQRGMKAEAEDMYRAAIALGSVDPDARAELATLTYARGNIDEAAQLLRQVLEIDPSNRVAVSLILQMKRDGVAE
jgi:protein O-mannosyl-transferase